MKYIYLFIIVLVKHIESNISITVLKHTYTYIHVYTFKLFREHFAQFNCPSLTFKIKTFKFTRRSFSPCGFD